MPVFVISASNIIVSLAHRDCHVVIQINKLYCVKISDKVFCLGHRGHDGGGRVYPATANVFKSVLSIYGTNMS